MNKKQQKFIAKLLKERVKQDRIPLRELAEPIGLTNPGLSAFLNGNKSIPWHKLIMLLRELRFNILDIDIPD